MKAWRPREKKKLSSNTKQQFTNIVLLNKVFQPTKELTLCSYERWQNVQCCYGLSMLWYLYVRQDKNQWHWSVEPWLYFFFFLQHSCSPGLLVWQHNMANSEKTEQRSQKRMTPALLTWQRSCHPLLPSSSRPCTVCHIMSFLFSVSF